MTDSTSVTSYANCPLCVAGELGRHPDSGGTHEALPLKVGDRIVFEDLGKPRPGIIRGFQWADWTEESLIMVDIDPPLPGSPALSNGRRIEKHQVVRRGGI